MKYQKKVYGAKARDGGDICLYRGTVLLRQERYNYTWCRKKIIERWLKDIKNLNSTEQYYLVFKPNTI
jgi:hypothetical protein